MSSSSHELSLIMDRLMTVGEDYSMEMGDLRSLVIKNVILCLKYVGREYVFESLFEGGYVDWGLEQQASRGGTNLLGDHHFWIPLLRLFSWEEPERPEQVHPRLRCIRQHMSAHNVDVGGHTLVCKFFLVSMLESISALQTFGLLVGDMMKRDPHQPCALVLAALADQPCSPKVCEDVLIEILGVSLKIDIATLAECMASTQRQRVERERGLRMKQMASYVGRPRLRDRLQPSLKESELMDTALGTWESYIGFCQVHQFPNVLSDVVKQRLYFLAAQTTWGWGSHVASVIRHSGEMSEKLAKYPVSKPDQHIIASVIAGVAMDGSPPFTELISFRSKCFRSFPVSQMHRMTLSQVLRLYTCAYQNPTLWKSLWKAQQCLISPLIIKDVEAFVMDTPFAAAAFMHLMCGGKVI